MRQNLFTEKKTGQLVQITGLSSAEYAFVPNALPPDWQWPLHLWPLLLEARTALASLNGIGKHLPNPQLLLRPLQYREAAKSNSLEGTYTQPKQQMLFELEPIYPESQQDPTNAYREVYNYGKALRQRFESNDQLPLSLRLIKKLHSILMDGVRGADKEPGEFRRVQVHIGQPPRFIPPPPHLILSLLDNLEKYFHSEPMPYDPLVNAFLVHYQFETIHPFRDGNGRVGRLLLSITIAEWCGLSDQWLHMSAFFDSNRDEYIDRLFQVSVNGDWEGWIEFCLKGVLAQARDTEQRCEKLLNLSHDFKARLTAISGSNRLSAIVDSLFDSPVLQIPSVADKYSVTYPTAKADIEKLVSLGILDEIPEYKQKTFFSPHILQTIHED